MSGARNVQVGSDIANGLLWLGALVALLAGAWPIALALAGGAIVMAITRTAAGSKHMRDAGLTHEEIAEAARLADAGTLDAGHKAAEAKGYRQDK